MSVPKQIDLIFIAANARSLIANRGPLIAELVERGVSVGALVPDRDYLPEVESLGIPIWRYPMQRTGISVVGDLRTAFALRRLLRRIRPAVVFAYGIKPIAYGIPAAHAAGARCFGMITGLGHVFTTETFRTRVLRRLVGGLYRFALDRCERVFFQNPDDEAEFISRSIVRDTGKIVRTAGSGIDLDRFATHPLPEGPPVFLFIGRLLVEKGIVEFVEAAAQVKARWPEARFVAVGPHDPILPHAVSVGEMARLRATGAVEFVGGVKDVRPWLASCSVLVLPSYREGTPRAVLEAMSVGRAIITTDAIGCRETVSDGVNGFLVPPKCIEPLASAMERLLENPAMLNEMARASRRLVEDKYDVRAVNEVILQSMGY